MSARPIPPTSALTEPYWESARRGELTIQRCADCTERAFPPRLHCPNCGGPSLTWEPVSGRGTVHSYTVAHRAPHPVFADQLPLIVAIVALAEGPRMVTNLVGCEPGDVEVGMAVEACFEPIDDSDAVLPMFTPTRGADSTKPA